MAGKKSQRKGKRVEYYIRDLLRQIGFCERVPCSGNSRAFKGDLILRVNERELKIEVKARKDFKTLYSWLEPTKKTKPDLLLLKANHKVPLVVMTIETFLQLFSEKNKGNL
ncbi:MAG: hypothetical protein QW607_08885 [Desulfurococcaceae archaeon]